MSIKTYSQFIKEDYRLAMAGFGHGDAPITISVAYHTTPAIYLDTIMSEGLLPRKPASNEPTAVFLSQEPYGAVKLSRLLYATRKDKCDYVLLKVDTTGLKLFMDPYSVSEGGLYSLEAIPAERLEVLTVLDYDALRNQGNWKKTWDWWFWKNREKPDFLKKFDIPRYTSSKTFFN